MPTDNSTQERMFTSVASWQATDLSQKESCRQQGLTYHIFHYWYCKYREQQPTVASDKAFVRLTVKPSDDASCEVIFADGTKIVFREPVPVHYLKSLLF